MSLRFTRVLSTITGVLAFGITAAAVAPAVGVEHASFNRDVFPILQQHCVECHQQGGPGYQKSGLDMTSYEGIMKGTKFGAIVVPGSSFTSNLSVLIEGRARPEINMPHARKPLSRWQRLLIRRWIDRGAKDN